MRSKNKRFNAKYDDMKGIYNVNQRKIMVHVIILNSLDGIQYEVKKKQVKKVRKI